MRQLTDDQRQASADSTVAIERRGLCAGRLDAPGPAKNGVRWWCTAATESRRAGNDHGPALRRCLPTPVSTPTPSSSIRKELVGLPSAISKAT